MITLTTSQAAAVVAAQAEPRVLVEIDTENGTYGFATERLTWSGVDYRGRLLNPGTLEFSIEGEEDGVVPSQQITVELANADGWVTKQRPSFWRARSARVKEVFLDVPSDAIRTTGMIVTGLEADLVSARITLEEQFSVARRSLIPGTDQLVTLDRYPNADTGSPALGQPIPIIYGRCYAPLLLVDQRSSSGDAYVVCQGSANLNGFVVDYFQSAFSPVTTAISSDVNLSVIEPYSVRIATRAGLQVTEILLGAGIPAGNPPIPRYAEMESPLGEFVTPAQVFCDLMTRAGIGSLVDSPAALTAHNLYLANSYFMDCSLIDQRPLEEWLNVLAQEGMCRFRQKDKVAIVAITSATPVASFYPGNILSGTFAVTDIPMGTENSNRTVFYRERTTDPFPDANRPASFVQWAVGSGAQVSYNASFIGRKSVANRVAHTYANMEAQGIRHYKFGSTIRLTALEEGDVVTMTHTAAKANAVRCEIRTIDRENGTMTFDLREQPSTVFDVGNLPKDATDFGVSFQRIPYNAGSYYADRFGAANSQTVIGSHRLGKTPVSIDAVVLGTTYRAYAVCQSKLIAGTTTNNSQFTVVNFAGFIASNFQDTLLGWDLRA